MEKNNEKLLFSKRLNILCEEKKLPSHGRQAILKSQFKVSQEAVRKWLSGESTPKHEHKVKMCEYFKVNYEWLATGKGCMRSAPAEFVSQVDKDIQFVAELMKVMSDSERQQTKSVVAVLSNKQAPEEAGKKEKEQKKG